MRILLSFLALTMLIFSSLWAILHPWMSRQVSKTLAKLALIIGLILLVGWWITPSAAAEIQFLKEADQWVYQSQQILLDAQGNAWEVTAFKQMDEGDKGLYLRVEAATQGPAGALFDSAALEPAAELDAIAPLKITTDSGETATATNVTPQQFIGALPEPAIGQYDVRSLLPKIKTARSLRLYLPTKAGSRPVTINLSSETLDEWLTVGSCDYIMCAQKS